MTKEQILKKHEDLNGYHFHSPYRKFIKEAMQEYTDQQLILSGVSNAERTLAIKFAQALLMDFEETTELLNDKLCWQLCGTETKLSTEQVFDKYMPEILANDC